MMQLRLYMAYAFTNLWMVPGKTDRIPPIPLVDQKCDQGTRNICHYLLVQILSLFFSQLKRGSFKESSRRRRQALVPVGLWLEKLDDSIFGRGMDLTST